MTNTGYIIENKKQGSGVIIINLTKTKKFGVFIPKFKDLNQGDMQVLGIELKEDELEKILAKSKAKISDVELPADVGPTTYYERGYIKTIFMTPKKECVGLTFVRGDKVKGMKLKKNQWLVIRRKNLLS